ncbi:MAG: hypothetical protein QG608_2378, partial [Actinomycetota bacterium]|nr:hypothetical protein [Actinomycetota bacterium]
AAFVLLAVAFAAGVLTAAQSHAAIHLPVEVEIIPTARLVAGGVAVDVTVVAQCDRLDDPWNGYQDDFWVEVRQWTPRGWTEGWSVGVARCDTRKHRYVVRLALGIGEPGFVTGTAIARGIGPGTSMEHPYPFITTRTITIKR